MTRQVYLAGPITEDPETHRWRKQAAKLLGDKFFCDDPCASKFDREMLKEGEKIYERAVSHQAEVLLPKSFQSVENCDIVLVNFAIEPKDRPVIGTIMEVAWAWILHKVIIAIDGQKYYTEHPMIKGTVTAWAESLEEAVAIIKEFFTLRR